MKFKYILLLSTMVSLMHVSVEAAGPLGRQAGRIDDVKARALTVLEQKCNVCHVRNNPRKVFTPATMELHAERIYKQVFVKRRMPKGDAIRLSAQEEATLLQWLETMGVVKK
ncbi:hypothetical protein [Chryseolinea lacunae]|uniref:Cytochrome c domain-containing protein n=1 Tax=Chryseolinea lacunae TaxID=2801331 RepID=A0ABS1KNS1_9BACT|nr:hypothetical protein [Chryseolinea lacunae]MBL0741086.1 hypothetical protein [Chryseolinea lacunae]